MAKPKSFDSWTPEKQEEWREGNKQRQRKYRAANREKIVESWRKYHAANREKITERQRKYRAENRKEVEESYRKYHAKNREKCAEKCRKHRNQKAADQFFIMAGAAEQLSKLQPNQTNQ